MKKAIHLLIAFLCFLMRVGKMGVKPKAYSGYGLARGPARNGNQVRKPHLGFGDPLLRSMQVTT